jgi:hypothetical protein
MNIASAPTKLFTTTSTGASQPPMGRSGHLMGTVFSWRQKHPTMSNGADIKVDGGLSTLL